MSPDGRKVETVHIDAPGFYAAVIVRDGLVAETAPALHYMRNWTTAEVVEFCHKRGWKARLQKMEPTGEKND